MATKKHLVQKKPIIIISVLCVISLVFGYLSGLKDEANVNSLVQHTTPDQIFEEISELSRFQLVKGKFTWQAAKVDAEARGGHLATITNSKEDELIENLLLSDKGYYWLGGTDTKNEGVWTWITGEPWGYTRWYKSSTHSEPDNGGGQGEDYLVCKGGYADGYMWADTDIHDMRFTNVGYILEVPLKKRKQELNKEPDFPKEGLVAYYPFNGNAKDESGNGNDGLVKGALLVEDRNGKPLKAYSFNGQDSFIDLPASKQINYIHHISVSFWINASEKQPSGQQWSGLITRTDHRHRFSFTTGLYPNLVLGSRVSPQHNVDNKAVIASAKWMHIVFTHDGSGCALFIDGKQKSKITNRPISLVSSDLPVTIGAEGNGNGLIRFF